MKRIPILAIIFIFLFFSGCDKSFGPNIETYWETEDLDETPPILSVLPIDLNTVIAIIPFGSNLPETKNPTFEYYTNSSLVKLNAVCAGTVTLVSFVPAFQDYSITVKHKSNSAWTIIYDHVKNCRVAAGDVIAAGAELGTVGTGDRVELQINRVVHGIDEISVCPFLVAGPAFISGHNALMQRLTQGTSGNFSWCNLTVVTP